MRKRKYLILIIILSIISVLLINSNFAINNDNLLISDSIIEINEKKTLKLSDNNTKTSMSIQANQTLNISNDNFDIYGIYIIYELKSATGTLIINNVNYALGENNYLHEYINLEKNISKTLSISYTENVKISEIYLFNSSTLPSWVQTWNSPTNKADLLLFSTHSDDEHLFFAGLLPTYIDKGYCVQVAYLTNHNSTPNRLHEQLNGLWAVGVTNYPIIGPFTDAYSTTLNGALANLKSEKYSLDDVISFQVTTIRNCSPLVIVGHDEKGEYSHGQHILNTHALKQAILLLSDETYLPSIPICNIQKVYLHLYNENTLTLDYDIPLNSFDGKTAYEVSKIGYSFHDSQQYTWFTKWLLGTNKNYTKATQITKYRPTSFGLYYTAVGNDVFCNDIFENVILRKIELPSSNDSIISENSNIIDNSNIISNYSLILILIFSLLIILILINLFTQNKNENRYKNINK